MAGELVTYMDIAFKGATGVTGSFEPADALATDYDVAQLRKGVQTCVLAEALLDLTGLASDNGWVWMRNLDASTPILVRAATGDTALVKLDPGDAAGFRLNGAITPYVLIDGGEAASGATADLEFFVMGGNT